MLGIFKPQKSANATNWLFFPLLLENQLLDIYQPIADGLPSLLWMVKYSSLRLHDSIISFHFRAQKTDGQGVSLGMERRDALPPPQSSRSLAGVSLPSFPCSLLIPIKAFLSLYSEPHHSAYSLYVGSFEADLSCILVLKVKLVFTLFCMVCILFEFIFSINFSLTRRKI